MAWLTGAFALVCLVQAQASKPTLVEKILNFTGGPQLEARSGDQIGWMQVYCYDVGFKTSKSAAFYLDYGCWCGKGVGQGEPLDHADWCCWRHDMMYDEIYKESSCPGFEPVTERYNYKCARDGYTPICMDSPDKDLCRWATCVSDKALLDCWKEAPPWLLDNKRSNPAGKFIGWDPLPFSKYQEICPKGREPRKRPKVHRRRKH